MATKDFDDWTLDDAQQAVRADAWVATNRAFYDGDHWQDGAGWIGPMPSSGDADYSVALSLLETSFTSRNVIAEVAERHASGVIGRSPQRSWVQRGARDEGMELPAAVQAAIEQVTDLMLSWRTLVSLEDSLWEAVVSLLLQERSAMYLYIPPGVLRRNGAGELVMPEGAVEQQISRIRVRFPSASQCRVITDPDTLRQLGVYVYQVGEKARADLTYLDDRGWTVLRTVGDELSVEDREPSVRDLGGRLLMYEMTRPLFITEQVRQGQRALNLALSMIPRNVVTGGFLERVLLNAQLPGRFELDGAGNRRFIPEPFKVGAGTLNVFQGSEMYDKDGKFQGYASPSMHTRDPVPIDASEGAVDAHERAILAEVDQKHVMLADSADASGYARVLARAEFIASMMRTAKALKGALTWLEETPLALAESFAGGGNLVTQLESRVAVRLDPGPISPDEARVVKEMRTEGLISDETARVMVGIEDPDAESQRMQAQQLARGSLQEAQMIQAYVGAGLSLKAALLRLGHDEETATKLSRGDVVDDITQ